MRHKNPKEETVRSVSQHRQNAPVFSYYSSRNRASAPVGRNHNHDAKPKSARRLAYQLPAILTAAIILFSLAYLSTLTTSPKIVPYVESTPNLLQDSKVYAAAAADILDDSILNRSKLTIDTDKIAAELKQKFPELAEVSVVMPLAGRRPIIELQPADPALIIAAESGVFILNADGRAVMDARKAPAGLTENVPLLADETATPVELGSLALTKDMVAYVNNVSHQLRSADMEIESMVLPTLPHELHLRVVGEEYYVKLNTLGDARIQSGAFLAVHESLSKQNQLPAEYIDVRLEDKVFYK